MMQKVNITLNLDDWKLRALEYYLKNENSNLQKKVEEAVGQLYEQVVPGPVREFVEGIAGTKPKRPTAVPKPPADPSPKAETRKEDANHGQP